MAIFAGPTNAWWNLSGGTDTLRTNIATTKIVQSGLVLNLDAGVSSSYPGSGTTWTDLSGNGNTGTLTNGPTFSGANGGSIVFDGVNDYVSATPSSSFRFGTSDFSVNIWVYFNVMPTTSYVLFENAILGGDGGRNDAFVLLVNTSSKLNIFTQGSFRGASSTTLVPNTWYNITLTRTLGVWRYYINTLLDSTSFTLNINLTSGGCILGRLGDVSDYYLNGRISNTTIYNRALTEAEIQQNFNATRGRFGI